MLRKIATTVFVLCLGAAAHAQDSKPQDSKPMHRHQGHQGMMEAADADKDGTVTRDEFLAWRAKQFAHMDRNGDGVIDDADRKAAEDQREAMREQRGKGMLEKLDANGDGKITKDEFVNAPAPMFDKADTDGNGVLDAKELQAARDAMRAQWKEHRKGQPPAQ